MEPMKLIILQNCRYGYLIYHQNVKKKKKTIKFVYHFVLHESGYFCPLIICVDVCGISVILLVCTVTDIFNTRFTLNGISTTNHTLLHFQTSFHFDVEQKYFHQALDIFAQFFINPLLRQDSVDREIQAVDSGQFYGELSSMSVPGIDCIRMLLCTGARLVNEKYPTVLSCRTGSLEYAL